MPSDRGAYRAIPVVLLDGKDFHRLTERERLVFLVMKIGFGPAGIEVHYPLALAAQLAEQSGIGDVGAVQSAMDTLEAHGWIERDGNVVWIVRHLEFEPNMNVGDLKHRKSIQRHVDGLPRLPIIARFLARYAEWFPAGEFSPPDLPTGSEGSAKGLARVYEGPTKPLVTTEDREPKTEDRRPRTEKDADASSSGKPDRRAVQEVYDHWVKATGRDPARTQLTKARRSKIMARLRLFSAEQLRTAIDGVMLSDHHRQKPEWTDLVSCFGSDEKVENHIARTTAPKVANPRHEPTGAMNGSDRRIVFDEPPPTRPTRESSGSAGNAGDVAADVLRKAAGNG